ncbi:hypothetical protein G6F60_013859 [Rhizopus arrhizus]|nr:hypothetical protein G6F30_013904 [Rhizopus arrhizus]KAG1388083.1 hypothetical protein G6F60_013859 [Rhizopus arrhizus]
MLLPIVDEVVPVITLLFQLCWKWSVIPSDWRTAQVVPIYKKGDALDPGNYRPISLTSIMRKLFELCLVEFVSDHAVHVRNSNASRKWLLLGSCYKQISDLCVLLVAQDLLQVKGNTSRDQVLSVVLQYESLYFKKGKTKI